MIMSLPSKKEGWETWKDQVEIVMAKKRTRIIAITVELFAYLFLYQLTAKGPEEQSELLRFSTCPALPHSGIPLPGSQPPLSASRLLFLGELGGCW